MTDSPSIPSPSPADAASDAVVFSSLTESDASAVLGGLHTEAVSAADAAAVQHESGAVMSALDQALEHTDLAKISDAQLADLESGDPYLIQAALDAAQDANAPDAGAQAAAEALTGPARVSIKALKPADRARTVQALDLIRAGHAPAEAFAEAFGISGAPQEAAYAPEYAQPQAGYEQEAAAANVVPEIFPQVAQLETQLSRLQQQYRTAKETYDPAATDLLEQMTDVKMDLREARREATAVNGVWMSSQAESHTRAMDHFSHLISDADSNFLPHCDDEILLAEAKNDPILNHPDWPEKIGRRVMDKFFSGHAAYSPASARGLSGLPPAPRHAVRLPGSPVGHAFSAGALSPQTAMAEIDRLTPEQQESFIRSLDRLTSAHAHMRR